MPSIHLSKVNILRINSSKSIEQIFSQYFDERVYHLNK